VIVCYRVSAGKAASDELSFERFLAYQWVVAFAAAIAVAVLIARDPIRGPGLGSAAGIVAAVVGSAGILGLNLALGAPFSLSFFVQQTVRPPLVMGWYVALVVAPVGYALGLMPRRLVRAPVVVVATAALTLVAGISVLAGREHLIAPETVDSPVLTQPLLPSANEATSYLTEVVPRLTQEYTTVQQVARGILTDPTSSASERAAALEEHVLPRISSLLAEWEPYPAQDTQVAQTHAVALSALRAADLKYRTLVQALRTSNQAELGLAAQIGETETRLWDQWVRWQTVLSDH
jgi:hypothetical protein